MNDTGNFSQSYEVGIPFLPFADVAAMTKIAERLRNYLVRSRTN